MTFRHFVHRWGSQLLALPAAILLLAAFSLAQVPPDPEEPAVACPGGSADCTGVMIEWDPYTCDAGKQCHIAVTRDAFGNCTGISPTCR